jgi:2-polyprenyl-6-methoxyphenol hydroxylase-like FAD-dependent oxidoreductase
LSKKFNTVVVVGGGIAGLSASAALAKYAQEVILLEKGKRLDYPLIRKSIPQGHHIHILLKAGQNVLDELFPGLTANLIAQGASRIQAGTGQKICEFGSWSPNIPIDIEFLGVSRPFLEQEMYKAVDLLGNVKLVEECEVTTLSKNKEAITAVFYEDKHGTIHQQACDLVIDASGSGSRLWLQALKDENALQVEKYEIDIFYSTLIFSPKTTPRTPRENILLVPSSPQELGASLIDIENGLTCVSLHGIGREHIPETLDDWLSMARKNLDLWERICEMEPCTELKTMRRKHMQWLHFEKCPDAMLTGYFPSGDVINQVNPIFGQGMTLALGHSAALDQVLASNFADLNDLRERYLKIASEWSAKAWRKCRNYGTIASSSDDKLQLIRRLARQKLEMSHSDPQLYHMIVCQSQMLN